MISKRLIAPVILFLILAACQHQHKTESPIISDSAEFYFQKAKTEKKLPQKLKLLQKAWQKSSPNDSLLIDILDHQTYYYSADGQYDSAMVAAERLLQVGMDQKDTAVMAKAYYRKARVSFRQNQQELVLANTYRSQQLSLLQQDSVNVGRRLVELANAQDRLGDLTGANSSATDALKFLKDNDSVYLASAYNIIALSTKNLGDEKNAISEYENALRYAASAEDSLTIFNNIALLHLSLHEYKQAEDILKKNQEKLAQDSGQSILINDNLAYAQWLRSGKDSSEELLKNLELRKNNNDRDGILSSYSHLVRFYRKEAPGSGLAYAREYLKAAKHYNDVAAEVDALQLLIELAPAERIRNYSSEYIRLTDSIENARNNTKNFFAKIKYDEENKLKQIHELKRISQIQSLQLERQKDQKLFILLVTVILSIIGLFIFYYFRQRHRREKLLAAHQTETRISKRIHDELANDLYNVMSRLQPIAPTEIVDKLENIYSRTRNISRENAKVHTGADYANHLIASLTGICSEHTRLIIRGENTIDWNTLNEEKKVVIFRVLQELMVNMKKHSRARLVAIIFAKRNRFLEISYSDNGVGSSEKQIKNGNGIQNVENRIFSLNGSVNFETEKGKGLKVSIKIPI